MTVLVGLLVLLFGCKEDPIMPIALGSLNGQVLLKENNQPIEGASITTNPATTSLLTDVFGEFSLIDIPAGTYNVRIEKDDLITKLESVTVLANQSTDAVFRLEPDSLDNKAPNIMLMILIKMI